MVVCPLCEHQQDFGVECEMCGKDLGGFDGLGPPPISETKVEGLEVTVADRLGDVPVERVGELEVTHFDPVEVGVDRAPDVEPSALPSAGEVPVDQVADMTTDRAAPDGAPRAQAPVGAVACRYCHNVQASGLICDRCGMRLPRLSDTAAKEFEQRRQQAAKKVEVAQVRCRSCGAPGSAGERCRECGKELPLPDA